MKNTLPLEIKNYGAQYRTIYKKILNKIKKHDDIVIFRHIMPDFDALGSQFGLCTWLKDNFPNKSIHVVGDNHVTFTPRIYPETDKIDESYFKDRKPLAIILDVSNASRIADPRFKKCRTKIKIDHHPDIENMAKISIVDTSAASTAEIIVDFILNVSIKENYILSKEAASYFYSAIVGDSGRFQYSSTSKHTFAIAMELLNTGINISDIYNAMYLKKIDDLKVTAYILNHFSVSKHGVAYYVLPLDVQKELNITTERGKENVNIFSNIEGINAWCSITEDNKEPCFRISIRSKKQAINGVATKWGGGGHAQASGAKINSLDELDAFIKDLDDLFVE